MSLPLPSAVSGHQPGPGLIVFGDSLQLRFVNQRARDLLGGMPPMERGTTCDPVALEILQMSEILLRQLQELLAGKEWSYADLHREIPIEGHRLDVRAFGFAGLSHRNEVHIVMLLNTVEVNGSMVISNPSNTRDAARPLDH